VQDNQNHDIRNNTTYAWVPSQAPSPMGEEQQSPELLHELSGTFVVLQEQQLSQLLWNKKVVELFVRNQKKNVHDTQTTPTNSKHALTSCQCQY
jgi:hypothetical protein